MDRERDVSLGGALRRGGRRTASPSRTRSRSRSHRRRSLARPGARSQPRATRGSARRAGPTRIVPILCRSYAAASRGPPRPSHRASIRPTPALRSSPCHGGPPASSCSSSTSISASPTSGRGGRGGRLEPRRRRRPHAGRVRQGLLRRVDRGRAGQPLPRPRLRRARSAPVARDLEPTHRPESPELESGRGTEARPGAADGRPLGRGRPGCLPAVHELRRRRDRVPAAEPARRRRLRREGSAAGGRRHRAGHRRRRGTSRFASSSRTSTASSTVAVVYTGSVPDLFRAGRHIFLQGELQDGEFVGKPDSLVTKCPSKYAPKSSTEPAAPS